MKINDDIAVGRRVFSVTLTGRWAEDRLDLLLRWQSFTMPGLLCGPCDWRPIYGWPCTYDPQSYASPCHPLPCAIARVSARNASQPFPFPSHQTLVYLKPYFTSILFLFLNPYTRWKGKSNLNLQSPKITDSISFTMAQKQRKVPQTNTALPLLEWN